MGDFIIDFLIDNLLLVILSLACLFLLSFKHKKIRYFTIILLALASSSILIYFLHDNNIVNNSFYYSILEIVCLLMKLFEISVSFIFNIQAKIYENINFYSLLIVILYTLDAIYSIDVTNSLIIKIFILKTYFLKTKFIYKIKTHILNLKYKLNDFSKSTVVLLC